MGRSSKYYGISFDRRTLVSIWSHDRKGSQTIAMDRRRSQTLANVRKRSQMGVSIWSQMIEEHFAICDPRSAIVCDHMATGPAGNGLSSLPARHFLSCHFSVRRRLSNIYVTPSFIRANNMQITFDIRQVEQIDSRLRPSLLSSWDSLAFTFVASLTKLSLLFYTHLW